MTKEERREKEEELRIWREIDMMDVHGTTYRPFERWNQLSPSEENGEQEFKR